VIAALKREMDALQLQMLLGGVNDRVEHLVGMVTPNRILFADRTDNEAVDLSCTSHGRPQNPRASQWLIHFFASTAHSAKLLGKNLLTAPASPSGIELPDAELLWAPSTYFRDALRRASTLGQKHRRSLFFLE
jgi:hypothetical protein